MKAAIVTIGDEILIGQIVDTNSAWMSQKMTDAGFEIEEKVSIGDEANQIKNTIDDVFTRVDVILMTGGLGPTKDDITKKTLCEYYGTTMIFDDAVLENINNVISSFTTLNELTRNQAYVPKGCTVIQNRVGTAPVTWFEREGKVLVSMPGVPFEMRYVMENEIIPRLQKVYDAEVYLKQVLIVGGYTESNLAIHLTDFEDNLPKDFGLAYLPSLGIMKLRLFVKGEHRKDELVRQINKLKDLLGDAILSESDLPMAQVLSNKLMEKGLTLGTAESCTGGNIAHLLTSLSGSSAYFKGSVVAYANEVKINVLKVSSKTIDTHGAVSEPVVIDMAKGLCELLNVDCGIAVSGIAGPTGGSENKPVGTTWICTKYRDQFIAKKYQLGQYRESNIERASTLAMQQMLEMIR